MGELRSGIIKLGRVTDRVRARDGRTGRRHAGRERRRGGHDDGGARPGPRGELSSPKSMSASSSSGFPPGEMPSPISNWSRPLVSVGERGDVAIVSRVAPYDVRRAMVEKCHAHGTPCSGASVGG